jgi:hypothetical protein
MNSRFSGTNRGIMSKRSFIIIAVLTLSFSVSAKDVLKEISLQDFQTYKVEDLNNGDGVLVKPNGFLSSSDVSDSDKKKLPGNVNSQFNDETQLITHHVLMKLPRDYKSFTSKALKNRGTVEKHLLYNSDISLDQEDFTKCLSSVGSIKSDINLPKFLEVFDYPEKLECQIKVNNPGTGKKFLRPEMLKLLPENLDDKDVRFISLDMSSCNMIFKGISQNVFFIKAPDGNTLVLFDNYSLVKKSTLQKIESVKILGSRTKFINGQMKKNMTGLLKFINASPE